MLKDHCHRVSTHLQSINIIIIIIKTRYSLHRRLSGHQGRSVRVRKILPPPPPGIRSPDCPALVSTRFCFYKQISVNRPHWDRKRVLWGWIQEIVHSQRCIEEAYELPYRASAFSIVTESVSLGLPLVVSVIPLPTKCNTLHCLGPVLVRTGLFTGTYVLSCMKLTRSMDKLAPPWMPAYSTLARNLQVLRSELPLTGFFFLRNKNQLDALYL